MRVFWIEVDFVKPDAAVLGHIRRAVEEAQALLLDPDDCFGDLGGGAARERTRLEPAFECVMYDVKLTCPKDLQRGSMIVEDKGQSGVGWDLGSERRSGRAVGSDLS